MPQISTFRVARNLFHKVELTAGLTGLALFSVACSSTADYYPPEYYADQPGNYYQVDPAYQAPSYYHAPVIVNERPVQAAPYYETYPAPVIVDERPFIQGEILTQQELDALERRERELAGTQFGSYPAPSSPSPPVGESAYTEQQADETARRLAEAHETFARGRSAPSMPLSNVSKPDVYRPEYVEPAPAHPVYQAPGSYSLLEQVQRALADRGYPVGRIDGVMGPRTRDALGRFQAASGLPVTRSPDTPTLQALGVYFAGSPTTGSGYLPPVSDYARYK